MVMIRNSLSGLLIPHPTTAECVLSSYLTYELPSSYLIDPLMRRGRSDYGSILIIHMILTNVFSYNLPEVRLILDLKK